MYLTHNSAQVGSIPTTPMRARLCGSNHPVLSTMSNNSGCIYTMLSALQRVEMPAEGVGGEGGRILREKLTENRVIYNTLFAQQPVGNMGR
jgi:hypothetical protein